MILLGLVFQIVLVGDFKAVSFHPSSICNNALKSMVTTSESEVVAIANRLIPYILPDGVNAEQLQILGPSFVEKGQTHLFDETHDNFSFAITRAMMDWKLIFRTDRWKHIALNSRVKLHGSSFRKVAHAGHEVFVNLNRFLGIELERGAIGETEIESWMSAAIEKSPSDFIQTSRMITQDLVSIMFAGSAENAKISINEVQPTDFKDGHIGADEFDNHFIYQTKVKLNSGRPQLDEYFFIFFSHSGLVTKVLRYDPEKNIAPVSDDGFVDLN